MSASLRGLARELGRRARLAAARLWIFAHPRAAARIRAERAWLFGAAAGRAYIDNSAALFRHVRRHRPDIAAYWVIDPGSADAAWAEADGPTLSPGSVSTYARGLLAAVHVISHGAHDVPTCASPASRAFKVRLGHGLTALKRTKARAGHDNRSANAIFDLVPVASEFERRHKLAWDIPPDRLAITGLARFDALLELARARPADPRRIVYMPTWRDRLDPEAVAQGIGRFLGSRRLRGLLETHEASLEVFLHLILDAPLRRRLAPLSDARVRLSDLGDPQPLFAEAGLLITDYSSVAWDMLYLDKPVLFYRFDQARFDDHRGGYVDSDALPGPAETEAEPLIDRVDAYLTGEWRVDPAWAGRMKDARRRAFAFFDDGNCGRIVAEIERRLGPASG